MPRAARWIIKPLLARPYLVQARGADVVDMQNPTHAVFRPALAQGDGPGAYPTAFGVQLHP
jgi:hypothetical protein